RIGDERKSADHLAVHHVVERAAGRVRALLREDPVVVAVVRLASAAGLVTLRGRRRDEIAERALLFAAGGRPVEPILLAGLAHDPLRIGADTGAMVLLGILVLRIDEGEACPDGVELVAPDAAEQDFLAAGRGVELPGLAFAHD